MLKCILTLAALAWRRGVSEPGRRTLPAVFAFRPEIVFYQAGVDALATDALGRLSLTPEGMAARDTLVFDKIRQTGVPLVITLGGGYSNPIEQTVDAHERTFRLASALKTSALPCRSAAPR